MTQDEIIEMARKSDFEIHPDNLISFDGIDCTSELIAFAKLVAEKAIKEALAQPKQEPAKDWIASHNDICALLRQAHDALALTCYPPQRTWVELTDEEIVNLYKETEADNGGIREFARSILRKAQE